MKKLTLILLVSAIYFAATSSSNAVPRGVVTPPPAPVKQPVYSNH